MSTFDISCKIWIFAEEMLIFLLKHKVTNVGKKWLKQFLCQFHFFMNPKWAKNSHIFVQYSILLLFWYCGKSFWLDNSLQTISNLLHNGHNLKHIVVDSNYDYSCIFEIGWKCWCISWKFQILQRISNVLISGF